MTCRIKVKIIRKCPSQFKGPGKTQELPFTGLSTRLWSKAGSQLTNNHTVFTHLRAFARQFSDLDLVITQPPLTYYFLLPWTSHLCLQLKIYMCTARLCLWLRGCNCVRAREQALTQDTVCQCVQALPPALWVLLQLPGRPSCLWFSLCLFIASL